MTDKLSNELLDAANGRGAAMKKKEDDPTGALWGAQTTVLPSGGD